MKNLLLISLAILGFATQIEAQNVDSLRRELMGSQSPVDRARTTFRLAKSMTDVDSAVYYATKAAELGEESNDNKTMSAAYYYLAGIYADKMAYDLSVLYYNKCIDLRKQLGDPLELAKAYFNISIVLEERGDYSEAFDALDNAEEGFSQAGERRYVAQVHNSKGDLSHKLEDYPMALQYLQQALQVHYEEDNKDGMARSYNRIANVYLSTKRYEKALEYYQLSRELWVELKDETQQMILTNNIALTFQERGEHQEALMRFDSALIIAQKLDERIMEAFIINNKGLAYRGLDDYRTALDLFFKAQEMLHEMEHKGEETQILLNIAHAYGRLGQPELKYTFADSAFRLSKLIGLLGKEKLALDQMITASKELGEFEQAMALYETYQALVDSAENQEAEIDLAKQEMQLEYQRKENQRAVEKAKQEAAHEAKLEQEREQKKWLYSGLALVLLLAVVLFLGIRRKQKDNHIISEQKAQVEEKNREIVDSINYAKHIQQAMLPDNEEFRQVLPDSFVLFKPRDIVSGDFYWYGTPRTNYGADLVVFAVADCTGHGVPGGFLSMVGHNFLHLGLTENTVNNTGEALNYLHRGMLNTLKSKGKGIAIRDGMDIAMCAINFQTLKGEFSGAKNSMYLIRQGELLEYKADKLAIADVHGDPAGNYTTTQLEFEKGDCIYLFSDGFADQFGGPRGKKYKSSNFKKKLIEIHQSPMLEQEKILADEFEAWRGPHEQIDDVCIIGVRV